MADETIQSIESPPKQANIIDLGDRKQDDTSIEPRENGKTPASNNVNDSSDILPSSELIKKEVGSTWVTTYQNAQWPVVLCSENSVPQTFLNSRRGSHELPAILLGRHKYIWVLHESLRDFDPNFDYLKDLEPFDQPDVVKTDDQATCIEKQRRVAFRQDAMAFKDADYWNNYIKNKSDARKLQRQMDQSRLAQSQNTPKRRRSDDDDEFVPSSRKRRAQDSSSGKTFKYTGSQGFFMPKLTPPKNKRHSIIENSDEDTGTDDENSLFVPKGRKASDPFVEKQHKLKQHKQHRESQQRVEEPAFDPPEMGPNMCKIFAGSSSSYNIVPLSALEECPYLLDLQKFNDATGEHNIDLTVDPRALELNLNQNDIHKIYEYFHTGNLGPKYLPGKKAHDPAPFGKLSAHEANTWAQTFSMAFLSASKIQHEPLQEHLKNKLQGLGPLPPMGVLIVATACSKLPSEPQNNAEIIVQNWAQRQVAEGFWTLAKHHSDQLQRVLKDNAGLRETVFQTLSIEMSNEQQSGGE